MLAEFEHKWDVLCAKLTFNNIASSRTDRMYVPSALPLTLKKVRNLEEMEIDKMLCMNLIDPVQSEWVTDFICLEEWQLRIFCIPYRKQCCDREKSVPNYTNWRVYRVARRSAHILDIRTHFTVLENRNWRPVQRQSENYIAPWNAQISTNVLSSEERAELVPMSDGNNMCEQFSDGSWSSTWMISSPFQDPSRRSQDIFVEF